MSNHLLLDISSPSLGSISPESFMKLLRDIADNLGMTVLGDVSHTFEPQGFTGLLLLSESHISIHTWPENNYAAMDVYTCGSTDFSKLEAYIHSIYPDWTMVVKEIGR